MKQNIENLLEELLNSKQLYERIQEAGYAIVPISPTKEMLEAAWSDALAEDAAGVWSSMVSIGSIKNIPIGE